MSKSVEKGEIVFCSAMEDLVVCLVCWHYYHMNIVMAMHCSALTDMFVSDQPCHANKAFPNLDRWRE